MLQRGRVFNMKGLAMSDLINQVLVSRSLFYYHRGRGGICISNASADLPRKI